MNKEKAIHTKNAITFYQKLLQTRIKLQKPQTILNKSTVDEDWTSAKDSCLKIIHQLGVASAKRSHPPFNDIESELNNEFKRLRSDRDSILSEWHKRLTSLSGDSFKGFSQSPLELITKSLENEDALIQKTQINRVKEQQVSKELTEKSDSAVEDVISSKNREKVLDASIFDDSDYYAQMLADFINSRTADATDPASLGQHFMEVQKIRSRMKKRVDTRASKGRKVRYTIMPKLENFVSSRDYILQPKGVQFTDHQRNMLLKNMFGEEQQSTAS